MRGSAPFSRTDEQRALRNAVADVLARHSDEAQVRALMGTDTGFDPAVWRELAAMGLTGLLIGEEYGGAGAGPVEMGIAMEEMGRALLVSPFLSTAVLVPSLLAEIGDPAECAAVLPRIAAGDLIAAVAFAEDGSARLPTTIATSAAAIGGAWHVTGYKHFVLDGQPANLLYILAGTDAGPAVFAVDAGASSAACNSSIRRRVWSGGWVLASRCSPRRWTARRWHCSASRPVVHGGQSRWPPNTPKPAISSAVQSAASRPSSTCAPTCC